jgi:hypothetical protein
MRSERVYELALPGSASPMWVRGSRWLGADRIRAFDGRLQRTRARLVSCWREDFWFCCGLPLVLVVASITVLV